MSVLLIETDYKKMAKLMISKWMTLRADTQVLILDEEFGSKQYKRAVEVLLLRNYFMTG